MKQEIEVFFGCSMRGGHSIVSQDDLVKLANIIEELGYKLISKHQTEKGIIQKENQLTPSKIHDRDYSWLLNADIGIFEISNPSLGVGAEISDMINAGKPVLCLFQGDETKISAYIRGKQGYIKTFFGCYSYKNIDEAKIIIRDLINTIFA